MIRTVKTDMAHYSNTLVFKNGVVAIKIIIHKTQQNKSIKQYGMSIKRYFYLNFK